MEDALERVEICGTTLATVLRKLRSTPGDSDGLLFGRLHRQTSQNLQDEGSSTREHRAAIVTGCCCTGSLLTFYDGAGSVDSLAFENLTGKHRHLWGSDPIIGWFVARRASAMRPSMRESQVTANLCRHTAAAAAAAAAAADAAAASNPPPLLLDLPYSRSSSSGNSSTTSSGRKMRQQQQEQPFLFMLLTEMVSRENHVQTQEYRVFQYHRASRSFQARSVVVRNVGKPRGTGGNTGLYGRFVPVAPLPWFNPAAGRVAADEGDDEADSWRRMNEMTISSGARQKQQQQALLNMYAEKMSLEQLHGLVRNGGGVKELELLYTRMLSRMDRLVLELRHSEEALRKQEDFNERMNEAFATDHV